MTPTVSFTLTEEFRSLFHNKFTSDHVTSITMFHNVFAVLEICSNGKADVVFLVDGSISVNDQQGRAEHFFEMRDFASQILDNFNINPNGNFSLKCRLLRLAQ